MTVTALPRERRVPSIIGLFVLLCLYMGTAPTVYRCSIYAIMFSGSGSMSQVAVALAVYAIRLPLIVATPLLSLLAYRLGRRGRMGRVLFAIACLPVCLIGMPLMAMLGMY